MANSEHIKRLLEGVSSWNNWRLDKPRLRPDFRDADMDAEFQQAGWTQKNEFVDQLDGPEDETEVGTPSRRYQDSCQDFVRRFDLSGANLEDADFRNARMTEFNLEDTILERTEFGGADLSRSRFRGTRMSGTGLSRANLVGADFTEVEFSNANLAGADLTHARLDGADLRCANLAGTRLARAEPWKAKLYEWDPRITGRREQTIPEKGIGSIADLIRECKAIQSSDNDALFYFRGESRICGSDGESRELQPSVMRCPELMKKEGEMLLELMSRRPEDFPSGQSAFSQWVLAQHHGLKTRFLDITRNPLVALFFSCHTPDEDGLLHVLVAPRELVKPFNSDAVRIISNFTKLPLAEQRHILGFRDLGSGIKHVDTDRAILRLYDFIRAEKPAFAEKIDPRDFYRVFIVEPQYSFARIRAQSGAFLVSAFHERFERNQALDWNDCIPIYDYRTFTVQKGQKEELMEELKLMNVTMESLFPSLEEAARAVVGENRNSHRKK